MHTTKQTKSIFKILLGVGMMLIIFLSGCVTSGNTEKYFTGFDGLVVEFFKSNPKMVYEDDDFALAAFVKNIGSYSINDSSPGKLSISYDSLYLYLNGSRDQYITMPGRSITDPIGGEEYYEFLFMAHPLNSLRESVTTTINFNLCYPYRSELTTAICVDTKISSQDQSVDACKSQAFTSGTGQGAPLAITRIEPEMVIVGQNTVRPQYKIFIENRGQGFILNKKTPNERVCDNININRTSQSLNKLTVHAFLSNIEMQCDPVELKMKTDGETFVRCSVKDSNLHDYTRTQKNYVAPLTVILEYGYVQVIPQDIEIQRKYDVVQKNNPCGYYEVQNSNGNCISLCEYCTTHSTDTRCQKNIPLNSGFRFDSGFSCSCSKAKCDELTKTNECIFGYCSGEDYCCKVYDCQNSNDGDKCGDNFACINKKCSTTSLCEYSTKQSGLNYTCHNTASCNQSTIIRNLCWGDKNNVCCSTR